MQKKQISVNLFSSFIGPLHGWRLLVDGQLLASNVRNN